MINTHLLAKFLVLVLALSGCTGDTGTENEQVQSSDHSAPVPPVDSRQNGPEWNHVPNERCKFDCSTKYHWCLGACKKSFFCMLICDSDKSECIGNCPPPICTNPPQCGTCCPFHRCVGSTCMRCYLPECSGVVPPDIDCLVDSDCPFGRCLAKHCSSVECIDDGDCGAWNTCIDHQCLRRCTSAADCLKEDETCSQGACVAF
jgi:hypothetical protein